MPSFNPSIPTRQADGYTVWEVPEDVQCTAQASPGETIENVLVDQTARQASLRLVARGDGIVVRNVGFKGQPNTYSNGGGTPWQIDAGARGGRVLVENVYMNAKGMVGNELAGGAVWNQHEGVLDVRHTFIAGYGNNAWYGSNVGKVGQDGTRGGTGSVTFDRCYHRDNVVSQFRFGSPGSYVTNSIAVVNDPDCQRGTYYPNQNARGVWVKHFPNQRVENCSFYVSPDDCNPDTAVEVRHMDRSKGDYAEAVIRNCQINPEWWDRRSGLTGHGDERIDESGWGQNPAVDVIGSGVPMSAEMAARGDRVVPNVPEMPGGSQPPDDGNGGTRPPEGTTIEIANDGAARTSYEIVIDGEIVDTTGFGTGDSVSQDRTTASGFVRGGADAIVYTGCVRAFSYDGPKPTVMRGGSTINADNVVECPPQDEPPSNGGDQPPSNGGGGDTVDRAVQALGALAIGGSIYTIIKD